MDLERDDVENLIKAENAPLYASLARIEERIIGIDGNGTGRMGAVQRIELAIFSLKEDVDEFRTSIHDLKIDVGGSLKTKTIIAVAGSVGVVILGAASTLAAHWLEKKIGW